MRAAIVPSHEGLTISTTDVILPPEQLLAGRRAVIACVPPAPLRAMRPSAENLRRALILLVPVAIGGGFSIFVASASGQWWIGVLIFAIFAWIAIFLAIGIVGAAKLARADRLRRYGIALEDPIGRLLPNKGSARGALLDPASYRELLALPNRPVLVVDEYIFHPKWHDKIRPLAPAGRMPEPETLDISRFPAGSWVFGLVLVVYSTRMVEELLETLRSGAPVDGLTWRCVVPMVIGVYLLARDPMIRRNLGISGFLGRNAVIGAGWIVDEKGRTWTVDDTVVLVTNQGASVEVRLIHAERVHAFFLPVMLTTSGHARGRAWMNAGSPSAATSGSKAVGADPTAESAATMPGPDEPLRLLLSSWSYPEPRPDLAMRE